MTYAMKMKVAKAVGIASLFGIMTIPGLVSTFRCDSRNSMGVTDLLSKPTIRVLFDSTYTSGNSITRICQEQLINYGEKRVLISVDSENEIPCAIYASDQNSDGILDSLSIRRNADSAFDLFDNRDGRFKMYQNSSGHKYSEAELSGILSKINYFCGKIDYKLNGNNYAVKLEATK